MRLPPPNPIVPRRRRLTVPERVRFDGGVEQPLDEAAARDALRRLAKQGVESVAISLLFSFVNPAHERRLAELAAEELPGVPLSISHEVMPKAPEYERTSTTVVNAYIGPRVSGYLDRLSERLSAAGYPARAAGHAVERRRDDARLPARGAGAHPGLGAGRRRDRRRARRPRQGRARPPVRRHGRHELRRVGRARRRRARAARLELAPPLRDRAADGERRDPGRGRRLALPGAERRAPGGARERRCRSGSDLLRARRHPADGHGREPRARPALEESAFAGAASSSHGAVSTTPSRSTSPSPSGAASRRRPSTAGASSTPT